MYLHLLTLVADTVLVFFVAAMQMIGAIFYHQPEVIQEQYQS